MSGDLRSALHAARTKQRLRYTAITAKDRVNGVFMTITYFVKNNSNDWRPTRRRQTTRQFSEKSNEGAYAAGGALCEKGDASKNELATILRSGLRTRAISRNGTSISCADEMCVF